MGCTEIHHEIELGVVIGSRISRATPKEAFAAVGGYALVLDMTVREFQVIQEIALNAVIWIFNINLIILPLGMILNVTILERTKEEGASMGVG